MIYFNISSHYFNASERNVTMDRKLDVEEVKKNIRFNGKLPDKKVIAVIAAAIVGIIIIIFAGASMHIHKTASKYDDLIMPGVSVDGIDVGSKTKEEAVQVLNDKFTDEIANRDVIITVDDNEYTIDYQDLDLQYNIEDIINQAFAYERDLSSYNRYKAIKHPKEQDFTMEFTYNDQAITDMVNNIASEVNVEKKDATLTKVGSQFVVTDDVVGKSLDVQPLLDEINEQVKTKREGNVEVSGTINEEDPARTKDMLSTVTTLISTATTSFGTSDQSRATNIAVGARTINGTVLMPGESFSFNTVVGDTTPDKGYQKGGVYVGDKLEQGYGGGICQVSSTLHNAVLKTGLLPDQRTNHSMPVGYVDLGLDATISYGSLDYVFTNGFDYPMYIEGYTSGGKLTFNIYSEASVNAGRTYSFTSDVYENIPVTVKYEDDASLAEGSEVVKQAGTAGYKVKAYRITYQNGTQINKELLNNDTYTPLPRIIKKGTKKAESTSSDENKATETEKTGDTSTETPAN